MATRREIVRRLMTHAGTSYARQAGIRLANTPAPLYQLQVLALLLSARISSSLSVGAARELLAAGFTTPRKMLAATWQQRVDALGRGGYRRFDESTATRLAAGAELLLNQYGGDLRRLAQQAERKPERISELLQEIPGIGPLGAEIYLREVQAVWEWLQPYLDDRVATIAGEFGLPKTPRGLASAVGTADLSRVSAALVRAEHDSKLRELVLRGA